MEKNQPKINKTVKHFYVIILSIYIVLTPSIDIVY